MASSERHIDLIMRLVDHVSRPLAQMRQHMVETSRMNKRLGRDITNVGRTVSSMGNALLPVSAGIVGVATVGARAFVDFDATITAAGAKAGATAAEMKKLRETGAKLGADFPISATEAAQGMDRLAAAGYDANQIMGAMPSIITASVAAGEDLTTTSDVISNALNIWNLKSGDIAANTAHVADVVQMAANKSSLGMQDFGVAMQYAGAPAATLGVNIEELSTAMAIMKNNGIEASTIGTTLRSTFSRLASPPKAAAAAIDALGLVTKDANGNFVGLSNVVGQLRTSMQGLSNTQQVAYAKAIAGEDAYSGLLSLIKTSPAAYDEMSQAIEHSAGSSNEQFKIMQQTVKVTIDNMIGSFESLAISVGGLLTPQIKAIADGIGNFADKLNGLSDGTKMMIADVAGSIVAFTAFTLVTGKVVQIGGRAIQIVGDIGAGLRETSTATRGVAGTTRMLANGMRGARTAVLNASTSLMDFAASAKGIKWSDIGSGIRSIVPSGSGVMARLGGLKNAIVDAGVAAIDAARNFTLMGVVNKLDAGFTVARNGIIRFAKGMVAATKALLGFMLSPIGIVIMAIAGAVYLLYTHWDTFGPIFLSMWEKIKGAVGSAIDIIKPALDVLQKAVQPIINVFKNLFSETGKGTEVIHAITTVVEVLADILGGVLLSVIIVVASAIANGIATAINIAAIVIRGFIQVLSGIIDFIVGVFTGNWGKAWEGVKEVFNGIFGTISGICKAVMEGIKGTINTVIDSINTISVRIPDFVPKYGGQTFAPNIQHLYTGTDNWRGGPAVVNDRYGGEIVDLPTGSRVIPHSQSLNTAYEAGKRSGGGGGMSFGDININITGTNKNAKELAEELLYELSVRMNNMAEGAV